MQPILGIITGPKMAHNFSYQQTFKNKQQTVKITKEFVMSCFEIENFRGLKKSQLAH